MLEKNAKQVNKIVAYSLAACSVAIFCLFGLKAVGIFNFEKNLLRALGYVGLFTTLSPIVLYKAHVKDQILKYYMLLMMGFFIGVLGTFNGIGIYISYVLVPLVSCLYFDKRLTAVMSVYSYLMMTFGVFFNCMGKMEVKYLGWSSQITFRNYMIGFTIEYLVAMLFVRQLVKRARDNLTEQHNAYMELQEEQIKYRMLIENSRDIIWEYDAKNHHYTANRSIFSDVNSTHEPVDIEEFEQYIGSQPALSVVREIIDKGESGSLKIWREINFSYEKDGQQIPLWYQIEGVAVVDEVCNTWHYIGKLHDITQRKLISEKIQQSRVTGMYVDSIDNSRSSIFKQTLKDSAHFSEQDFAQLAAGHRFVAEMLDELKYSKDLSDALMEVLGKVGEYFKVDRIGIIETNLREGTNQLNFQWNSDSACHLENYFMSMTQEDVSRTIRHYDEYGYIEINTSKGILNGSKICDVNFLQKNIFSVLIGNQIWIPTTKDGEYNGAIFFDKADTTPYSQVEKFVLAEVVTTVSAYVNNLNAEKANVAKSIFLSNMSHEIRTPMNAIMGMAEVALRDDISDSTRKCLNIIRSSSAGLLAIINDILDFSKIESGKIDIVPEKYEILSLINDVKTIVEARNAEKGLELIFDVPEDFPHLLKGDLVRIKQVMINFANNAIKYTDEGSVKVTFGYEKKDDKHIDLCFAVKDTGQGIKQEDMDKLFQTFSQLNTVQNHHKEGTGLGLAISKQLMDLMGGRIVVESEYGVGSTFSFVLPQEVLDFTPAGKLESYHYSFENKNEDELFTASKAHILLVDDNEINLEVAMALLENIHMQIDTATDGLQAVNMAKKNRYDLILMDHFMPVMDGVMATREIRNLNGNPNQRVPIIALTADAVSGVKEKLLKEGMDDFISKPIDLQMAYRKIHKWLPQGLIETK